MDARKLWDCWQCGRPAPGGVCLGPHPDYNHGDAVAAQSVMNLDGIVTPGSSHARKPWSTEKKRWYWHEIEKPRRAQRRFEELLAAAQRTREAIERMNVA